jgi:hypothetical protein
VRVEELRRRVEQRAACGQARRVDQAVDATELVDGGRHGRLRLRDVADVGLHEAGGRPPLGQLGDELLAGLGAAARDDDGLGALARGGTGDRRAQALAPAADEHDLVLEQGQHDPSSSLGPVHLDRSKMPRECAAVNALPATRSGTHALAAR